MGFHESFKSHFGTVVVVIGRSARLIHVAPTPSHILELFQKPWELFHEGREQQQLPAAGKAFRGFVAKDAVFIKSLTEITFGF